MLGNRYLGFCAALALGEALGFASGWASAFWPAAAFVALLVLSCGYGLRLSQWPLVAVFFLGMALAARSECGRRAMRDKISLANGRCDVVVEVESGAMVSAPDDSGVKWVYFDSSIGRIPVKVAMPESAGGSVPSVGERWHCTGWLSRPPAIGYGRRKLWVKGDGSFAELTGRGLSWRIKGFLSRVRAEISRRVGIGLDHDWLAANLNRAILLGERDGIPKRTARIFAEAGTMHVFAISGLHVGIVVMILVAVVSMTGIPSRFAGMIALPMAWAYVVLIGMPVSAVRAATMASFYYLAPACWRKSNALVAWSLTFLSFHLMRPEVLLDVGSQLSFTVMLAIVVCARWAREVKLPGAEFAWVSVAAWLAGVPLSAYTFGRVAPCGMLANLALVPAAWVSVSFGVLGAAMGFCSDFLASHLNNFAALFTRSMVAISCAARELPYGTMVVEPWTVTECLLWYLVIVMSMWLVWSLKSHRRERL